MNSDETIRILRECCDRYTKEILQLRKQILDLEKRESLLTKTAVYKDIAIRVDKKRHRKRRT